MKAKGSTDGYGDCYVPDPTSCSPTGAPWFPTATGSGHPWPLLDGERAEQDLQTGQTAGAVQLLQTMENMTSGLGLVPEQAWEDPDVPASRYGSAPKTASIGFANGKPAGSAGPLIWAQAQYLRLVTDLQAGTLADQPAITADRYVRHSLPAALHVSITSPRAGTTVTAAHTAVTGTTAPGATVVISAGQSGRSSTTSVTAHGRGRPGPLPGHHSRVCAVNCHHGRRRTWSRCDRMGAGNREVWMTHPGLDQRHPGQSVPTSIAARSRSSSSASTSPREAMASAPP